MKDPLIIIVAPVAAILAYAIHVLLNWNFLIVWAVLLFILGDLVFVWLYTRMRQRRKS